MACGGSCTWTFDGTYWTCVDNCTGPGCECTDIVPVPPGSPAGTSVTVSKPLSASDPMVQTLLLSVVDGGIDKKTKKRIWKVPDALLRRVIALHNLTTTPALNNPTFVAKYNAALTGGSPVSIDVDCV